VGIDRLSLPTRSSFCESHEVCTILVSFLYSFDVVYVSSHLKHTCMLRCQESKALKLSCLTGWRRVILRSYRALIVLGGFFFFSSERILITISCAYSAHAFRVALRK